MARDRYVLLTGSKNNAGDFLIASRAKELIQKGRPDREYIEYERWKPLSGEQLETINDSRALLLTGGPALQYDLYPGIYPLVEDISRIRVPIIMMGIGYKCHDGSWEATRDYQLSPSSYQLLDRIEKSGFFSGVRDHHTLNVLFAKGYRNFLMTGCPALYEQSSIGEPLSVPEPSRIRKVVFSLGVLQKRSKKMLTFYEELLKKVHRWVQERGWEVCVAFHHRIGKDDAIQQRIVRMLEEEGIPYEDISGSDEGLRTLYGNADLHIGSRVHAHLFMSSMNKASVLLSEDGRAKGMRKVLGGLIFDPYRLKASSLWNRGLIKLGLLKDLYIPYKGVAEDIFAHLDHELEEDGTRLREVREHIDAHYRIMQRFLSQLP
ncbi:MAG: polysaccharide pyruvyl transferase family protein [Flavobacteriales bacterium]